MTSTNTNPLAKFEIRKSIVAKLNGDTGLRAQGHVNNFITTTSSILINM